MENPQPNAPTITIVLADDHQVVRSGLRLLLESDARFKVVAETGDVASTEEIVFARRPDVLVLDLNMAGESSLDAIPGLRERAPETQIVVLTMQENPAFAREALRSGALGYVLKDAADAELLLAIELASQGRS
jgi:two-component system response regulator NreC